MFVCQAEDGIRDLVRSRGLGDVYKRQALQGQGNAQVGRGGRFADASLAGGNRNNGCSHAVSFTSF